MRLAFIRRRSLIYRRPVSRLYDAVGIGARRAKRRHQGGGAVANSVDDPAISAPAPDRGRRPSWLAVNLKAFLVALTLFLASEAVAWIVAAAYGHWVIGKRLDLLSFCRWDCGWYGSIVDHGYDATPTLHETGDAANWAFFPPFPLLAGLLHRGAGLAIADSLLLAASLLLPVCIYLFIALVEAYEIRLDPWIAGSLVAFNPYVLYAHAGYGEPLYFALCAGSLLALRRGHWLAAGLLGGGTSATRLVGVFLILPMIERLLRRASRPAERRSSGGPLAPLLAIALVPLGLALFGWYLYFRSGDLLAFAHIQIAWGRLPGNPLLVWWSAASTVGGPQFFALATAIALLAALYLCLRKMAGHGLFLAAATLLPLSTGIGSMPRFVFWQPVFLLVLAQLLRRRQFGRLLLPLLWAGSVAMTAAWFTGAGFVN